MRLLYPLLLVSAIHPAIARETPLPRPRPAEAALANYGPAPVPEPPDQPSPCQMRMTEKLIAVFESLPAIVGPSVCGAPDMVKLTTIMLPDDTRIVVSPPAIMRCTMAEAITHWVRDDIAPVANKAGLAIRTLDNFADYECRGRNRVVGARVSEHGYANALDVRGFRLGDNKLFDFTDRSVPRDLREAIRKSVCARFMTVLGPRSDGYHENHIHLDLAERRNGYRICQWEVLDPVPDVPLPRARPAEAPQVVE